MWHHGWILLAGLSGLFVVVIPFVRFGLLTTVLGALRLGYRADWLGPAFRWAIWLDAWAMIDVFLLASFVGYFRLSNVSQATISVQIGGQCFFAAAILTMLSRASLDRRTVWRLLGPEATVARGEKTVSCLSCDLIQPLSSDGKRCPRCRAMLHSRKPGSLNMTAALLLTAFVLFFPANIYPMNVSTQLGSQKTYTIFTGIMDLFTSGLWPLGAVIFCTSILIPAGKIFVIAWCELSVWSRSARHLVLKTRLCRIVAELGRWSNTDPFTIVFFVPLMELGAFASANAGGGATAFMLMTFLSMIASLTFDPRLMWDAAERGSSRLPWI